MMDTNQNNESGAKNPIWVTRFVTEKDWREYYSNLSYTLIKKVKGGVRMGFLVVDKIPNDCIEAKNDELKIIRDVRLSNRHYPVPEVLNAYPEDDDM